MLIYIISVSKDGKEKDAVGKITTDHEGRGKTVFTPAAKEGIIVILICLKVC